MPRYFLDTGYVVALELSRDQNHRRAVEHWSSLRPVNPLLVTTDYVFDEVVTFLNPRGHHAKAVEVGNTLLRSPSVQLVRVDGELFGDAWDIFVKHSDKTYSLTDCVSFVVSRKHAIEAALTVDEHFAQAGFQTEPA